MDRKVLKWFLVILGLSASLVSMGIGIYVYNNPLADHAQFLLQLPFLLVTVTLASAIVFNWLRKIGNKSA
ncbi:hypothetical protein [Planococcus beijingensis]|uniref:hypothetical protein n=1 Tax=Planococcus beijingensis TaxID=2782551 RepID=UPI00193B5031|nr:hypothetical protein [Planococcus beijingensis]